MHCSAFELLSDKSFYATAIARHLVYLFAYLSAITEIRIICLCDALICKVLENDACIYCQHYLFFKRTDT